MIREQLIYEKVQGNSTRTALKPVDQPRSASKKFQYRTRIRVKPEPA